MVTYGIPSSVLLLRSYDCTAALRCVQGAFATDNRLALTSAARSLGLATDLGDSVPVVHDNIIGIYKSFKDERDLRSRLLMRIMDVCDDL